MNISLRNTITPDELAAIKSMVEPNGAQQSKGTTGSPQGSANAAKLLLDTSAESGRFIALPLSMIGLRRSDAKLSLNELIVLAYIHGFQRVDPLSSCKAKAVTIASTLGISEQTLSKRLAKSKKLKLIVAAGHGEENRFRVDERRWAELCDCQFDTSDMELLHTWTSKGLFCRIPLWTVVSEDFSPVDQVLFGRILSFYARREPTSYRISVQNGADELGISRSAIKASLYKLSNLGVITKNNLGDRVPAEYMVNAAGCLPYLQDQ